MLALDIEDWQSLQLNQAVELLWNTVTFQLSILAIVSQPIICPGSFLWSKAPRHRHLWQIFLMPAQSKFSCL